MIFILTYIRLSTCNFQLCDELKTRKNLNLVVMIMRIEHIAMYVNDLEATKEFFVKYFNATSNKGYHNKTVLGIRSHGI